MAIYFTSDLHFGHKNILETCQRNYENCGKDFETIEEMNDFLIDRWNKKVGQDDTVYVLGDFSFRSGVSIKEYLVRLNGHKHLIVGNHDYKSLKNTTDIKDYFESVSNMEVIKLDNKLITLCHYPMLEWNGSRRAKSQDSSISWLIHGHIHNSKAGATYEYIKANLPCALNAGVDVNNYEPVTFDELLKNNNLWYGRENVNESTDDSGCSS